MFIIISQHILWTLFIYLFIFLINRFFYSIIIILAVICNHTHAQYTISYDELINILYHNNMPIFQTIVYTIQCLVIAYIRAF